MVCSVFLRGHTYWYSYDFHSTLRFLFISWSGLLCDLKCHPQLFVSSLDGGHHVPAHLTSECHAIIEYRFKFKGHRNPGKQYYKTCKVFFLYNFGLIFIRQLSIQPPPTELCSKAVMRQVISSICRVLLHSS